MNIMFPWLSNALRAYISDHLFVSTLGRVAISFLLWRR